MATVTTMKKLAHTTNLIVQLDIVQLAVSAYQNCDEYALGKPRDKFFEIIFL